MAKRITEKQEQALILLTSGEGMTYTAISAAIGIDRKTLYRWLHEPQFASFQARLKELEDERWISIVDVAKKSAYKLCEDGNQKMVEFVLKNEGYNPTTKVEADVKTDINITIEE
jgi:transposase